MEKTKPTTEDLEKLLRRANEHGYTLESEWAKSKDEIKQLTQWVNDLQSGQYVNCVYCGHQYGPYETTPVTMADALKEHVEQCPKHPMSALKREVERLRKARREDIEVLARQACKLEEQDGRLATLELENRALREKPDDE